MMNYLAPLSCHNATSNNSIGDKIVESKMNSMLHQSSTLQSQPSFGGHLPQPQQRSRSSISLSNFTNGRPSKAASTFPMKLHFMLMESERMGFEDVVCWLGNYAFKVIDTHRFSVEIMPIYFNQTKYKSFQRQ
jgi:hypothetical protein